MSENLQPGMHPDPDSLSAFVEGVLPEHERLDCLAHLAECPDCRQIVYLAEEPLPPEPVRVPATLVLEKVSFWKRWLTPIPVLSAAAAAGLVVFSVWLHQENTPAPKLPEMASMYLKEEFGPPPPAQEPAVAPALETQMQ